MALERLTSDVLTICSCTSTGTVDIWSHEVELFAVLVCDDGASSGSRIGRKDHSALKTTKQICEKSIQAERWQSSEAELVDHLR